MEQTDYLLRQLQAITILLKKLLANILKLKDKNPSECLVLIDENLKSILGHSLSQISSLSNEKFIQLLAEKKILNPRQRTDLAEILSVSSELMSYYEKRKLLAKALFLYESIMNEDKLTFSIELHTKMEAIRKQIVL